MAKPNDKQLQMILEDMVIARTQAGRLWNLQRQGQVGTIAPIDGHEAAVVGAVHALEPESDWVLPQYREPLGLRRYGPEVLDTFMLYNLGHPAGGHIPDPVKVAPSQISLGASIPHAVGLAWGMSLKNESGVVLVFFGDGASSEGDFYEAGNLAGVLKAPVILFCINNQWAISTPTHLQTAADSFASKAEAFGIPGVTVDGNDPSAVYEAVFNARKRALNGKGPTLIEATVYRLGAHTTADDPTRYVPSDELSAAQEKDPVHAFIKDLTDRDLWSDTKQKEIETVALEIMDDAFEKAKNTPLSANSLMDHCFVSDTSRQLRQRSFLMESMGKSNE
ncbi:MAG: thiamine pyrophosphate-dependent enzyme [Acidimicrobiales bacterium]|nr:thiamine pyrophosphate-dependent enzyme [Acidimicrobiales bacterium]|tara:strand:- start:6564 stop:7568 length:1005 start_codon:yes stop_codon:yes gene_type:complete